MKKYFVLLFILFNCALTAQISLIPYGSSWKYMDNGSNQGTAWYGTAFNDASWAAGNAELGYGDGDEATIVNACGTPTPLPTCSNKYITTYFRQTINVASVASFTAYTINLRRDDGIIVYINGTEVYRNNMPTGVVNYTTLSSTNCSDDGMTVFTTTLPSSVIVTGTNVIAAEVHQTGGTSSDVSFEFQLIGNTTFAVPNIVKGPYMQIGTQNSMIVRWETSTATDAKVAYGTSSLALTSIATNTAVSITHSVQISGLAPYTKYYYSIGTSTLVLQGDQNNYFQTSPVPGTPGNYRFWMTGDCGNGSTNQTQCKNQFITYNGSKQVDAWLTLGDNAYTQGTDAQFNSEFFGVYQTDVMKKMVLWPTPGNHDYNNGAATATTVPYFTYFSTPVNAEAGGVPSGNPAYYSFDYGNIHFLSLDSYGTTGASLKMYDTTGAQVTWIKQDLAATNKRWIIAYWHHPPYTMGSHNSDTESDLAAIRTNFIRILERYKVDLIMCGHSHVFERSKLMKGYYGNESAFTTSYNLSTQSAVYDGSANSCPYMKDSVNVKTGTVYVVSGSAGSLGGTQSTWPHNAMHFSDATDGGSFILDIQDNRLDAQWLCADGVVRDKFTMFKDVDAIRSFTVLPTQTTSISASWPGTYSWSSSATTRTISVSPTTSTKYWVKDPNSCVADTFTFKVLPAVNFSSAAPYCAGSPIAFSDLSSNTPISWSWSVSPSASVSISSASSQNPMITFGGSGIYTISLIANNLYGPGTLITKTISINPQPGISISANPTALCTGQSGSLTASGASSYTWSTSSNAASIAVSPTVNTTYTVSGTDANGCQNQSVQTLSVNPLPVITTSANPASGIICSGDPVTLSGAGALTYTWTGGISDAVAFTPTASVTYSVTGTDVNGCQNTSSAAVTVNPLPVISATANPSSAAICAGGSVTLTAGGATTYTWTGGITNGLSFTPSVSATYSVTGADANGCQSSASKSITVNPLPPVGVVSNNTMICTGQSATLTASGANTYSWSAGPAGTSLVVTPTITTTYTVTGTDANTCANISAFTQSVSTCTGINELSQGQAISVYPNPNSGSFIIDVNAIGNFEITIFNSIGELIYNAKASQGSNKIDLKVKPGIYYYTVSDNKTPVNRGRLIIE